MRHERTALNHKRRPDGKVALLILFGGVVLVAMLVGVSRQARLLRQLWNLGDPGMTLEQEQDKQGYRVTEVPKSSAAQFLRVGDRVLRLGDLGERLPRRYTWTYEGRPVAPGERVPVLFERNKKRRAATLRFQRRAILEKQIGPTFPPFGQWLFTQFLPLQVTLWGCFLLGGLVLLRRPTHPGAQLCFLILATIAFTVSYEFGPASLYPLPLAWLWNHNQVVDLWTIAFTVHLWLLFPEEKGFYRRFRMGMLLATYLPPAVYTGLALLTTLWPQQSSPDWEWLSSRYANCYYLAAFPLIAAVLLHSAVRAASTAGRRQARMILLGQLPLGGAILLFNVGGWFSLGAEFQTAYHLVVLHGRFDRFLTGILHA